MIGFSESISLIRIGNQTAFGAETPLEPFEYAIHNGFDAFEWFPDKKESGVGWDLSDINSETRQVIRNTARAHNVVLAVHAPWWFNPLQNPNQEIVLENISFAKEIGAGLLNIHLCADEGVETFAEAVLPLISATRDAGLKLTVENTPMTSPEVFNTFFAHLHDRKKNQTDHVGMCLDLGHANLCASSRNDYIGYLDRLALHVPIMHVHFHENYGDQDSHMTLFTGPSGLSDIGVRGVIERLKKRKFHGSIILEQWPEPHSLLVSARDRLRLLIGNSSGQVEKELSDVPRETGQSLPVGAKSLTSFLPGKSGKTCRKKSALKRRDLLPQQKDNQFAVKLLAIDARCRSWREKLAAVWGLLQDEAPRMTMDEFAYLSVYLRFLGTGELDCAEDGRHFRPNHHARLSEQIHGLLVSFSTDENLFVMRRIFPWLPSYDSRFTRAEPLTRIRDIAHRNDIPQELKKSIKETLQNKLHRCAGPEDLQTAKEILSRITADGAEYSSAFVREYMIFYEELKEFFNVQSLEKRLHLITDGENGEFADPVRHFLALKESVDGPAGRRDILAQLTELRSRFLLAGDASSLGQSLRLADIALEGYAFVLLSMINNDFERAAHCPWKQVMTIIALTLANLRFSGVEPDECLALEADMAALRLKFKSSNKEDLLRLKAALERCRRLSDSFSERILALFSEKAVMLGRELGVTEHAIQMYCEGDIRGSLVFQLSRTVAMLLRLIRRKAGLPPWEVLVPGEVAGQLTSVDNLSGLFESSVDRLVLAAKAEGDEHIPKGVSGIVLAHPLPHLCHLAIRARQEGVAFVSCADEELWQSLSRHAGERRRLVANASGVVFDDAIGRMKKRKSREKQLVLSETRLVKDSFLLDLDAVTDDIGGGKANGARLLFELSRQRDAFFAVPQAVVVPFGVMERALDAVPAVADKYNKLLLRLAEATGKDFQIILASLRDLCNGLPAPEGFVKSVRARFSDGVRVFVRSSANCEDREGGAGAGLYDSVPNVPLGEVIDAVRQVWSSLWTQRAAADRRDAGIPHDKSRMAVIIQEMLVPTYSFVLHTVNPLTRNSDESYVELAVGMGETLASGAVRGSPYRMVCNKKTGKHRMLAFADFSYALAPDASSSGLVSERIWYADLGLSNDRSLRERLASRLAKICRSVEEACGGVPQDIEGAVVGEDIFLVQTRPQQGVRG